MSSLVNKNFKNPLDKYPRGVYNMYRALFRSVIRRKFLEGEKMDGCPSCGKKKERGPEEYKRLINRLNRISGQISGIKKMVENSAYCTDILVQTAAATAALNAFSREMLSEHIRTCVADNIKNGNDEVIDELIGTLQKLMK